MENNIKDLPNRFYTTINTAKEKIVQFGVPGLVDIWLFGSCASGKVKTTSDVDLCIIVEEQITDRVLRSKIRECTDDLSVDVDVIFYAKEALNSEDIFTINLVKNHISLLGGI